MIFVTVGTQLPFDRLVGILDEWAASTDTEVFAQIAHSRRPPRNIGWAPFLSPAETRSYMERADLIVAHAGMGSILTSLVMGKPIIVMPRRMTLQEHRNDHQMATASKLKDTPGLTVAFEEADLLTALDAGISGRPTEPIRSTASPELLANVRNWIAG